MPLTPSFIASTRKNEKKKQKTKTENRLRYLASLGRTSANRLAALYESLPALCIHALCKADWPLRAARSRRDYFAGVARALAVRHLTPHAASSIISGRPLDGLLHSALVSNQFNAFPCARYSCPRSPFACSFFWGFFFFSFFLSRFSRHKDGASR